MWYRLLGLALFAACSASAEPVVRVKDGDTITVRSGGAEVDIRLADIDAPESDQPLGPEARQALQSLLEGREAELGLVGGDAYRRIVARVSAGGIDVNAEMVRRGLAWVLRDYDPAPELIPLENSARAAARGLWADAQPVPPWVWRRSATERTAAARAASLVIPSVECGTKRYCREMQSCGEALGFLRQCGVETIDGDGDGIPCEQLCRGIYRP